MPVEFDHHRPTNPLIFLRQQVDLRLHLDILLIKELDIGANRAGVNAVAVFCERETLELFEVLRIEPVLKDLGRRDDRLKEIRVALHTSGVIGLTGHADVKHRPLLVQGRFKLGPV